MEQMEKRKRKKQFQTCVTFTEKQWRKIKRQQRTHGGSIPRILREVWEKKPIQEPIIENAIAREVVRVLSLMDSSLRDIARWVNAGCWWGDLEPITEMKKELLVLRSLLLSNLAN